MRCHYVVLGILVTTNESTLAFVQPVSMARPRRVASIKASDTPEGPESELFDFLKSIIEKPIDWNINEEGKSPFGFDKNAELWNGRIAQISFVWIFLQEWIQGKGVFQSIIEGDLGSNISLEVVCLMLMFVSFQFCMLPFEQNVKIQVPKEWLDNPRPPPVRSQPPKRKAVATTESNATRWNLNGNDKAPYGMDLNAEVWNGRVAMVCFAWVFLQELIQDKGLLIGLEEKHGPSEAALLLFVIGLSGFITYLHNMFSLEAEAYRRSKLPPPEPVEAPKFPSPVAGKAFQFGQTSGDPRLLNGQQSIPGTLRPTTTQSGPPGSFRQPMSAGALPPRPNAPPVSFRQPMSPDGRLPPSFNPPRPNLQAPPRPLPPPNSFRPNAPPPNSFKPNSSPPNSFRPNSPPPIYGQTTTPAAPPNNSFRPDLQPGTFRQGMGSGAAPPNNNSFRPNLQPRSLGQPIGPGVVPSSNAFMPNQQQGNADQGMRAAGLSGPDGRPGNFPPGADDVSSARGAAPFEKSMIQSYEESLRTMTKETSTFPATTSQQGPPYDAPTYPKPPRDTPRASETPSTPSRTQLFKSDALSSVAKGDASFLDQIVPPTFSSRTSTEIVSPEIKPNVRPFPKPESFTFSPDTRMAQLGKFSPEQPYTRDEDTEQPSGDKATWSQSQGVTSDRTNDGSSSWDPVSYSSETSPPRYQSSPYNMPTKRTSYLDQLGPS